MAALDGLAGARVEMFGLHAAITRRLGLAAPVVGPPEAGGGVGWEKAAAAEGRAVAAEGRAVAAVTSSPSPPPLPVGTLDPGVFSSRGARIDRLAAEFPYEAPLPPQTQGFRTRALVGGGGRG